MALDGQVDNVVYQVIDKLWQQELPGEETIGLLQLIADEKYPVYLSMKNVDNPINRKSKSLTITFNDLSEKLKAEYEKEKLDDNEDLEIIQQYRKYFEELRAEVNRIVNDAEERLFGKYFASKITTNFLTAYFDKKLDADPRFMESLEFVLRSYGISNKKELMKLALERLRIMTEEIPRTMRSMAEQMSNFEKEIQHYNTKSELLLSAMIPKIDFPSSIVDRRKALTFFTEALAHVHREPKFHVLFNTARDGFDSAKFHSLCDNKGPTLIIVETKDKRVFGGYTSKPWGSNNVFHADEHAFLFSWDWKEIYRQHQNHNKAVYHGSVTGPIFGGGHDLALASNCQMNNSSCMAINHTYSTNGRERDTISGGQHFSVANYEVLLVKS